MRDYGRVYSKFWTDGDGLQWPVVVSDLSLKFSYPSHAALRSHVFKRDRFQCVRCGAKAVDPPGNYDGRFTLKTNTRLSSGYADILVLDHIVTRKAGGRSVVDNLQTLCETCNKNKSSEDNATTSAFRIRAGLGT